jgi:hypothetical protein
LISDFSVRSSPKSNIRFSTAARTPFSESFPLNQLIAARAALLNCTTEAWAPLWDEAYSLEWEAGMSGPKGGTRALQASWSERVPLRAAQERRQAQVEIDALVAMSLGVSADELCTIYRTQFAVLYGYDRNAYLYDANGRLVPNEVLKVWRQKQDAISEEDRTATNASGNKYTYELPFRTLDREADMRQAYAHFEQLLKDDA